MSCLALAVAVILTTEPHDEHHLGCDFVITEEIQEVGKRENVHGSAKQHQHLLRQRASLRNPARLAKPVALIKPHYPWPYLNHLAMPHLGT